MALIEAGILVLIVIMLFLQNFRAMLVPATTVPVTIIGAFAAMALLGFTVNLMTLFALILAIGIVVDDAIVIVENASHYIEQGLTPKDAAIKAMERADRTGAGHHAGADLGISAGVVSAGDHRADVPPVCAGDRGDGDHQRAQRADAQADAMRAVSEAACPRTRSSTGSTAASTAAIGAVEDRYIAMVGWMAHRPMRMMSRVLLRSSAIAVFALSVYPSATAAARGSGLLHRGGAASRGRLAAAGARSRRRISTRS